VLVRSWTQRGTLHIVAAEDLAWILELTRERQRQAAGVHRAFGIEADDIVRAERAVGAALSGGNRLTRTRRRRSWPPPVRMSRAPAEVT
jgi:hypothetical protein